MADKFGWFAAFSPWILFAAIFAVVILLDINNSDWRRMGYDGEFVPWFAPIVVSGLLWIIRFLRRPRASARKIAVAVVMLASYLIFFFQVVLG